MLAIDESYKAWCVDEAVATFGIACEDVVETAKARAPKKATAAQRQVRGENALRKMLGLEPKFRDIRELMPR